jgi:hypothetical protein
VEYEVSKTHPLEHFTKKHWKELKLNGKTKVVPIGDYCMVVAREDGGHEIYHFENRPTVETFQELLNGGCFEIITVQISGEGPLQGNYQALVDESGLVKDLPPNEQAGGDVRGPLVILQNFVME